MGKLSLCFTDNTSTQVLKFVKITTHTKRGQKGPQQHWNIFNHCDGWKETPDLWKGVVREPDERVWTPVRGGGWVF